ncbi:MAG: hypothetical protein NTW29_18790 [Bacteroidetes bacterium]|nr:hypothetical protein [Bacteroidota bacterium]
MPGLLRLLPLFCLFNLAGKAQCVTHAFTHAFTHAGSGTYNDSFSYDRYFEWSIGELTPVNSVAATLTPDTFENPNMRQTKRHSGLKIVKMNERIKQTIGHYTFSKKIQKSTGEKKSTSLVYNSHFSKQ